MKEESTQECILRPTLEEVRDRFETWRSRRKARSRIPKALWQAAVEQCHDHSVLEVSKALGLNYNTLKDRVQKPKKMALPPPGGCVEFVEVGFEAMARPPECIVEMEAGNGAKLKMRFLGHQKPFDPVVLARAFWRQGL